MSRPGQPRWYDALAPVAATVGCSGETHIVTWRRGRLVLEDHDLDAERAALALGGSPPACLGILYAWRDRRGWDNATRGRGPGFHADASRPFVPDALVETRELGVCRRWSRRWSKRGFGTDEGDLFGYLRRRALGPLLGSVAPMVRAFGRPVTTELSVRVSAADHGASVSGWLDAGGVRALALLPPAWLWEVWARRLALAGGHFVVAVEDAAGYPVEASVVAVRWEDQGGGRAPALRHGIARIADEPGEWSLVFAE